MKILLTGATGFLGHPLVATLVTGGHECHILTRDPRHPPESMRHERVRWLAYSDSPWPSVDAVINLAGSSVVGLWTARRRRAVLDSRVNTTRALVDWMLLTEPPPRVFVSASAIGIYGDRPGEPLDEHSHLDPKRRFRYQVCHHWEGEARRAMAQGGVRTVLLRIGNVLHPSGGYAGYALPWLRRGLTMIPGTGEAVVPWVSLDDVIAIVDAALDDPRWSGAVNTTAPHSATQRELVTALSAFVGRRPLGRVPVWMLRLVLGEFGSAILDDQRIAPQRAIDCGYRFIHPTLEACIKSWTLERPV